MTNPTSITLPLPPVCAPPRRFRPASASSSISVAEGRAIGPQLFTRGWTRFYLFLLRVRGPLFTLAAIPMHLAYYASNAVSVVFGWVHHHLFGEPIPPAEAAAHAQIGIATWPPAPQRSRQSLWERKDPR